MAKLKLMQISLVAATAVLFSEPPAASASEIDALFSLMDTNGDGVIQRTEFNIKSFEIFYIRDRNENMKIEPDEINLSPEAFAAADTDGDGQLSGVEFYEADFLQFEAADTNNDHKITRQEFEQFVRQFVNV
ncbi:MAG: EF-hand domain-containing protein [Geminicoccaceae bacterium]